MADYPQIQGRYYSWASLEISAAGMETPDFAKLDWNDKLTPGTVRGRGAHKRGRTTGEYDCDASFMLYLDASTQFEAKLAQRNRSIGLVVFDLLGYWAEEDGGPVKDIKIEGARIIGRKNSNAPGTDATGVEYELSVMLIRLNGVTLLEPGA